MDRLCHFKTTIVVVVNLFLLILLSCSTQNGDNIKPEVTVNNKPGQVTTYIEKAESENQIEKNNRDKAEKQLAKLSEKETIIEKKVKDLEYIKKRNDYLHFAVDEIKKKYKRSRKITEKIINHYESEIKIGREIESLYKKIIVIWEKAAKKVELSGEIEHLNKAKKDASKIKEKILNLRLTRKEIEKKRSESIKEKEKIDRKLLLHNIHCTHKLENGKVIIFLDNLGGSFVGLTKFDEVISIILPLKNLKADEGTLFYSKEPYFVYSLNQNDIKIEIDRSSLKKNGKISFPKNFLEKYDDLDSDSDSLGYIKPPKVVEAKTISLVNKEKIAKNYDHCLIFKVKFLGRKESIKITLTNLTNIIHKGEIFLSSFVKETPGNKKNVILPAKKTK